MIIKGLKFYRTCQACPEQYEVEYDGQWVGYVRLRWGHLTTKCPDVEGKEIYSAYIGGDYTGCFTTEEERQYHLNIIADKILEEINSEG